MPVFGFKGNLDRFDKAFIKRVHSYPCVRLIYEYCYSYGDNSLSAIYVYYDGGFERYIVDSVTAYRIMLEL